MAMKDKKIGKRFRIAKYKTFSYSSEKKQPPKKDGYILPF